MSKKLLTPYIKQLVSDPPTLTTEDFASAIRLMFTGDANEIESASFLTALKLRKLEFDSEYIATAVETILEFSDSIPNHLVDSKGYIDVVGTGGDSQNTFNVSTSAAIIAAGMGLPICKHGGKASTSASGSGDLMSKLGVDLMKVNASSAPSIVSKSNLCFLFAPAFHHGMGKVANMRANLGIPTIFNILGPLLNPIPIQARILGVYTETLGRTYCEAAVKLDRLSGRKPANTMVVWGEVGLDEISPIGSTKVWKYNQKTDSIDEFVLTPEDFGLPQHSLDLVRSGTPHENSLVLKDILDGKYNMNPGETPLVDYILMNTAALAVVGGLTDSWKEGVSIARESIASGSAKKALSDFIQAIEEV
ncbi:hypothetical protein CANARDRAFT_25989 [[Candida] arabinofermentans NRRL YB-2248]|uniref:Anthranilate phosphoribosyltransferase n=1 Tax=[Candida] arabinofermentans NRRL YB-2248 TaxID=983967 RepID=A0A1E4T7Q8_9ASCO|nr:hypothetical protein CANARDRAFT_25989 [[Candida] arabinofermentans NRRL YB-2248]